METNNTVTVTPKQHYVSTFRKGYDKQWQGETYIQLDAPDRRLKVSTFKSSRGYLYTSCQAVKTEKNSGGFTCESFVLFQDYNKTIMNFPECKRVNEKVITECHDKALDTIANFVKEANEMYASNTEELELEFK